MLEKKAKKAIMKAESETMEIIASEQPLENSI